MVGVVYKITGCGKDLLTDPTDELFCLPFGKMPSTIVCIII